MKFTEPYAATLHRTRGRTQAKDLLMRYTPAALALSLLVAVTSSASLSAPAEPLDPRAVALQTQGRAALASGDNAKATDYLEAALAVQPGSAPIVLDLADAARQRSMPGEALHYYRVVLTSEPQNINGLSGEGTALAEMGALDKARRNLTQVQGLCGQDCAAARALSEAIAKGPKPQLAAVVAVTPKAVVTTN
jgi:Flp pilus assembly protein TadD